MLIHPRTVKPQAYVVYLLTRACYCSYLLSGTLFTLRTFEADTDTQAVKPTGCKRFDSEGDLLGSRVCVVGVFVIYRESVVCVPFYVLQTCHK